MGYGIHLKNLGFRIGIWFFYADPGKSRQSQKMKSLFPLYLRLGMPGIYRIPGISLNYPWYPESEIGIWIGFENLGSGFGICSQTPGSWIWDTLWSRSRIGTLHSFNPGSWIPGSQIADPWSKGNLTSLSSQFYTRIPHDFGMKVPPPIRDFDHVREEAQLLESLEQISVAVNLHQSGDAKHHPITKSYLNLKVLYVQQLISRKL